MQELIIIEDQDVRTVFTSEQGVKPHLERIRAVIDEFPVLDMTVKKEREEIKARVTKITKAKSYIENTGKDLAAEMKKEPKLVDASRRHAKDTLTSWAEEVRKPLTEWEEAEKEAVNAIHRRINDIASLAVFDDTEFYPACEFEGKLAAALSVVIDDSFGDLKGYALEAKDKATTSLKVRFDAAVIYEAEQAELEALRKAKAEQEEKDRLAAVVEESKRLAAEKKAADEKRIKDAEDLVRRQEEQKRAEAKAEAENEAIRLKLAAETAERERLEAIEEARLSGERAEAARVKAEEDAKQAVIDAAKAAEQKAIDAKLAEEAEAKRREENKAHSKKINNATLKCLMKIDGMTEELGKEIIKAIAKKEIVNVSIKY